MKYFPGFIIQMQLHRKEVISDLFDEVDIFVLRPLR